MENGARDYHAYGATIRSQVPLPCRPAARRSRPDLAILTTAVPAVRLDGSNGSQGFAHVTQPDGTDHVQWAGGFHCTIAPDGRTIRCPALRGSSLRTFQTLLAPQAISFALLKHGLEPLHATTVIIDGRAIALLGDCGAGKSTLGACFLQAGYPLLTDDLLVLQQTESGWMASPGLPRIKLFPAIARRFLGTCAGMPLAPGSPKYVIRLDRRRFGQHPVPLHAIYRLTSSADTARVRLRRLSSRAAWKALITHTYNIVAGDPARLRQQFIWACQLAQQVPVKALAYPRRLPMLPQVVDALASDLAR